MPLFDFESFSIFAENYIISSENVAMACEINGEVSRLLFEVLKSCIDSLYSWLGKWVDIVLLKLGRL